MNCISLRTIVLCFILKYRGCYSLNQSFYVDYINVATVFSVVNARDHESLVLQQSLLSAILILIHGAWRSPVARLHGVQEVMGSNPVAPTYTKKRLV